MNLFYPSHDIALANGVRHFNPPAAALRLQEDLASLSNIWNQSFLEGKTSIPLPWGWDWDTRRYIHDQYQIDYRDLPSDNELETIRHLSSRRTMIPIIQAINQKDAFSGMFVPSYLQTEEEVTSYIDQHDEENKPFVLKTPWSSSGRGLTLSHVRNADGTLFPSPRNAMMRHALATLKKMGGIMGEEWIENKRNDFALLFYASNTEVHFIGYSLFDNDEAKGGTTYRQGYLLSNEDIERRLGIDTEHLHFIIEICKKELNFLLSPLLGHPWSIGYLGIDMLSYYKPFNGETVNADPCHRTLSMQPLELNLRTTMGTVCRLYHDRNKIDGLFHITPMQSDGHFKAEFLTSQR